MELIDSPPRTEQGRCESARRVPPGTCEEFVPVFYGRLARRQDLLFRSDQPSKGIVLGKLAKSILSCSSRRELLDPAKVQSGRVLVQPRVGGPLTTRETVSCMAGSRS